MPLAVQIVQHDVAKLSPRTVLVRWRGSPEAVSVATLGYCAGTVELGGRTVKARRIDGDANGLFADPDDRLWIDVNGDAHADDLAEQFPMIPSIQIAGRRYAVRGDGLGEHLRLDLVEGEGRVRLQPAGLATATKVRQIACMLVGEDDRVYACRLGAGGRAERPLLDQHVVLNRCRRKRPELELSVLA